MSNVSKKEVYAALKEKYPELTTLEVEYYGSGDNFDDFHTITGFDKDGNGLDISTGEVYGIIDDYCFHIFDMSGQIDFNDEGSEGTIKFDLVNNITTLDNYQIYRETRHTGTEEY
jgi:hypothetical protein